MVSKYNFIDKFSMKKDKFIALLAPSFVVDFTYPDIIFQLKQLGFDKVVELTFGAKMINREYHKKLKNSEKLLISSVCPGIVESLKKDFPEYKKNLMRADSPMVAMAKICKKIYPTHKIVFISPCNFKKTEAQNSGFVDFVIDYRELKKILDEKNISPSKRDVKFDKFYNDSTKIYPLAGGLSKTANLKGIVKKEEVKIIDGINDVSIFLKNPDEKVRFLDVTFCKGGCIGGPCISSKLPLFLRKWKVLNYMKKARKERIPGFRKGLVEKAKGISFATKNL